MPPSPCTGSIRIAAVSGVIAFSARVDVVEGDLVEALDLGPEAFEIFLLAAGGDGRQRAAVEGAFEGDDAEALGMALDELVAARRLDGAFERLGAGIGEEHLVGEGGVDQPLAEPALPRNLVEIGDVPELVGLLGQRRDQMRMAVAQRIDGDAAGEIEISLALVGDQPGALATVEGQGRAGKGLVKRRTAHYMRLRNRKIKKAAKAAALCGLSCFSAMKSTKTSCKGARQASPTRRRLISDRASWGKPKKPIRVAPGTLVTESTHEVIVVEK